MSKFVPTIIGVLLLAGAGYALYVWRTQELVPVAMVPAPTRPAPVPAPPPVVQEEPPVQEKIIDPPAAAAGTLDRNAALDLWAQKIVDEEGTGTDAAAALQ
ncbi:MAG TPA: hypothetical protein VF132_00950, partial [Rudaea sp.]